MDSVERYTSPSRKELGPPGCTTCTLLLRPHVTRLVVCDPRRDALLQECNQNDRVDARNLAELLQNNQLRPVYHGDHGLRALKELVRSHLTITKDLSRVISCVT